MGNSRKTGSNDRNERLKTVLATIGAQFAGWPKSELVSTTEFQFLVAVILSAQTTDKQVNKTTPSYFAKVRTPADALAVSAKETERLLSGVNYYKTKCRHVRAAAEILVRDFDSKIPKDIASIRTLPWVGIKTAKVVLSVLFDAPYVGVDTHVHRVLNRLGIVKTKTPEETDREVERTFTAEQKIGSHHPLVLFWRYRCTARNPKCSDCPLNGICPYYRLSSKKVP